MISRGVLVQLADRCHCSVAEIENALTDIISGASGNPDRSMVQAAIEQERIEIIRGWMRTPEGRYALERDA